MDATPFPPGSTPPPPPPPPPSFSAPPQFTPPPPPPRPRKSRGWMIVAIILFVVLLFSLFGNITQFIANAFTFPSGLHSEGFGTGRIVGPRLEECLLENNHSQNKIAVIRVDGIITSHSSDPAGFNMVDVIKAQLNRASRDPRVKAVILKVDSPGGEVMASDQINRAIRAFETNTPTIHGHPGHQGKPVICSMGSLDASGGYYISSGCRWIVANPLTITGSIGVIMHGYNYRGLMDKVGVLPMTFKSGKYKDMLSGDREPTNIPPQEREMVQNLINQTYDRFKSVVIAGRDAAHALNQPKGRALASDWENYADGRVLSGSQALKLGLVDQIGDFDDAMDRALQIAHINRANLIEYRERYDLSNFLSMFGESGQSHDIKLDLGAEAGIPKLRAGLMYFLYEP